MSQVTRYSPPGLRPDIDLDLSKNEGQAPPASLLDQLRDPRALIGRYPDTTELQRAVAGIHDVREDRVLMTAGADDALLRCFLARVGPGKDAVATYPSFEMLPRYAGQVGGNLIEVPWWEKEFPIETVAKAASGKGRTVFVVSPNNPTGNVIDESDLRRLAAVASLVVLDSAYTEFAEDDLTTQALELENVVVLRSLSKAWGLAGLRVGYLLGPPDLVSEIGVYGNPYPVTGLSAALARLRLDSAEETRRFVDRVRRERHELSRLLEQLGAGVLPSHANFVLAAFDDPRWVADAAASLGIGLRRFPDRPGLEEYLRIGLPGDQDRFRRLTQALRSILDPGALLFDLDGVLADTEDSQTTAIIETAAYFGVELARTDIEEARAAGEANDDWELTRRLCNTGGIEPSLAEVTARFESIYQGTPGRPGLKLRETSLVDPGRFADWAARFPIGIVTGRPRSDAEEFLERSGLRASVSVLITRDDAPLKPNPKPVMMALERLGVDRAWMIGDTPDDVDAARAAGVVPIGVLTPGRDPGLSRMSLRNAARIMEATTYLEEILP